MTDRLLTEDESDGLDQESTVIYQEEKTATAVRKEIGERVKKVWEQEENRTTDMNTLLDALLEGKMTEVK